MMMMECNEIEIYFTGLYSFSKIRLIFCEANESGSNAPELCYD